MATEGGRDIPPADICHPELSIAPAASAVLNPLFLATWPSISVNLPGEMRLTLTHEGA